MWKVNRGKVFIGGFMDMGRVKFILYHYLVVTDRKIYKDIVTSIIMKDERLSVGSVAGVMLGFEGHDREGYKKLLNNAPKLGWIDSLRIKFGEVEEYEYLPHETLDADGVEIEFKYYPNKTVGPISVYGLSEAYRFLVGEPNNCNILFSVAEEIAKENGVNVGTYCMNCYIPGFRKDGIVGINGLRVAVEGVLDAQKELEKIVDAEQKRLKSLGV